VRLPCLESHFAARKRVVGVAVGTLIETSYENVSEVVAPGHDQVELVPMFGSGMSPSTMPCAVTWSGRMSW